MNRENVHKYLTRWARRKTDPHWVESRRPVRALDTIAPGKLVMLEADHEGRSTSKATIKMAGLPTARHRVYQHGQGKGKDGPALTRNNRMGHKRGRRTEHRTGDQFRVLSTSLPFESGHHCAQTLSYRLDLMLPAPLTQALKIGTSRTAFLIHSLANSPDWISLSIFFICAFTSGVTTRGPRVTSPSPLYWRSNSACWRYRLRRSNRRSTWFREDTRSRPSRERSLLQPRSRTRPE